MGVSYFVHPFIRWWRSRLSLLFGYFDICVSSYVDVGLLDLLSIYPGVELMGHLVTVWFVVTGNAKQFSRGTVLFYIATCSLRVFNFSIFTWPLCLSSLRSWRFTLVISLKSFVVWALIFSSMIHWANIFGYLVRKRSDFIPCTWLSHCSNTVYWWELVFAQLMSRHLAENRLTLTAWLSFWTLSSSPLIWIVIFMPGPQSPDGSRFVMSFEIGNCVCLFQDYFGHSGSPALFPHEFQEQLVNFYQIKKFSWDLDRDYRKSVDEVGLPAFYPFML